MASSGLTGSGRLRGFSPREELWALASYGLSRRRETLVQYSSKFAHPCHRQDQETWKNNKEHTPVDIWATGEPQRTPEDSRGRWLLSKANGIIRRLKEETCLPEHNITLKKGRMHTNSLEDYDYNPSPGIV